MNLNELNSLTNSEIINSIASAPGTSVEKALQAELSRRQTEAINFLSGNISILNSNIEKLLQSLKQNPEK